MSTSPETSSPPRRLHWTTWLLSTFVLLVCVLLNVGGDYDPENDSLKYGWPWVYGEGAFIDINDPFADSLDERGAILGWYRLDHLIHVEWGCLFLNLAVAGGLVIVVAVYLETRRRRAKSIFQFTMQDWLLFCALFAGALSFYQFYYPDHRTNLEIEQTLNAFELNYSFSPSSHSVDYPQDFIWHTLRVPKKYRPYRRLNVDLRIGGDDGTRDGNPERGKDLMIPLELFSNLGKLKHMKSCSLTIDRAVYVKDSNSVVHHLLLPRQAFVPFQKCASLESLSLYSHGESLSEEHLKELAQLSTLDFLSLWSVQKSQGHLINKFQSLRSLKIGGSVLDDEAVRQISTCSSLCNLTLQSIDGVSPESLENLGKLIGLELLVIDYVPFDDHSLASISKLSNLRDLEFRDVGVTSAGWKQLSSLKSLETLTIQSSTFNDEALEQLICLPNLRRLILEDCSLTEKSFETLKAMKSLRSLGLMKSEGSPNYFNCDARRKNSCLFDELDDVEKSDLLATIRQQTPNHRSVGVKRGGNRDQNAVNKEELK